MKISLKSRHALIGGSSKGLGYAVAKQLAYSGAKVTLVARSEDLLVFICINIFFGIKLYLSMLFLFLKLNRF